MIFGKGEKRQGDPRPPWERALLENEVGSAASFRVGVWSVHEDGDGASEGGIELVVDDGIVCRTVLRRDDVQDVAFGGGDPIGLHSVKNVSGIPVDVDAIPDPGNWVKRNRKVDVGIDKIDSDPFSGFGDQGLEGIGVMNRIVVKDLSVDKGVCPVLV